ncbi:vWA domain-containing protein [Salipiger sp.]|uniref:vWA domain-containing protein n=1 Tax=Salipiger sp. TaxID=2078585 RepID=UPI003A97F8FD
MTGNHDHDDLDDLARALDAATPAPRRKAGDIALAMKNFDALQGSRDAARPTSDRPKGGIFGGIRTMLSTLSTRGALAASTAVAALAMVALIPVIQGADLSRPGPAPTLTEADAPLSDAPMAEAPVADALTAAPPAGRDLPAPAPAPMAATGAAEAASDAPMEDLRTFAAPAAKRMPGIVAPDVHLLPPETGTEAYPDFDSSALRITAQDPVSTFSIDVDTASWAILRNTLRRGDLPPAGAVRIEEMVNYFPYDYPAPEAGEAFRASIGVTPTPWNPGTRIVHIGLQGALPAERAPLNLVFLIDTSGSMQDPAKLPLLKQSFRLLLGQLAPEDEVSVVTYAGSAGRVLDPTPASERETILAALDRLDAGGGTAGQEGLQQAYATAGQMTAEGEVTRVILATDGDFNVGLSDPGALADYIAAKRDSGTYLSVLGFGRGNLDDATMQALAQAGNGTAAYIDTLSEAQKVLVDQLSGALFPIADDVKIQVEFNPAEVAEYRLIGYETRALRREDFNNDRVDAGEIGAGHQVTALYEITPAGSDARLTEPLRYGAEPAAGAGTAGAVGGPGELGFLRLRYKAPGDTGSRLIEAPILPDAQPLPDAGFALAVAGFGGLLRGDTWLGGWGYGDAIDLATGARGEDAFGYRREAISLMRLADSLSR